MKLIALFLVLLFSTVLLATASPTPPPTPTPTPAQVQGPGGRMNTTCSSQSDCNSQATAAGCTKYLTQQVNSTWMWICLKK